MQTESTKILVVEDEPYIKDLLARYLNSEGYVCSTAAEGETALQLLQEDEYHLVMADIMMPGMSGIDLLNIVKTLYPDTAVLMVTSVNDRETGVLAIELGAYGYVIKPFERNEILINVANALERRRLTLAAQEESCSGKPRKLKMVSDQAPIKISAKEAVEYLRSGMDDASLMQKFNLSAKALYSLFDELLERGYVGQSEIDDRGSFAYGTVVLDARDTQFPAPERDKPSIRAQDAVKCIRSGMDDPSLMKRYRISAKGLRSLFRKLVAAGVMDQTELDRRITETHNWAVLAEDG